MSSRPFLLVAVLLLAGCASSRGDSGPADAPLAGNAEFDSETGGVEGSVLDEENVPLAGAMVAILAPDRDSQSAVTDDAGRFVLDNVAPGEYTIAAQMLGYESQARKISVRVAEVTTAQFVLAAIAVHDAYSNVFMFKGYFECSYTAGNTGPCFFPFVGTNNSYVPIDPWANNKRQFDYGVAKGAFTVFNEMDWQKSTVASGDQMSVFLSYDKRTTSHWYCRAEQQRPVNLRWDRGELDAKQGECNGSERLPSGEPKTIPINGQILTTRANTGVSSVGVVGIAIQQSFDMYVSVFYWEPAPDDYTAVPDT